MVKAATVAKVTLAPKTANRVAKQERPDKHIPENTGDRSENPDPAKPGKKKPTYSVANPPPHLRSIPRDILPDALNWAGGDWYLLEPIPSGVLVHNNRAVADAYRRKG